MKRILRIIGNIGSGKSTLLELIKKLLPAAYYLYEPVSDNPILPLFYSSQEDWAASIQTFMETTYYQRTRAAPDQQIVTDYGLTRVFTAVLHADGLIDEVQLSALMAMIDRYEPALPETQYLYLPTPPDICLGRINERGRYCEKAIGIDYLVKLHKAYIDFVSTTQDRVFAWTEDSDLEEFLDRYINNKEAELWLEPK